MATVLPMLTENLTKFVGQAQATRDLENAYKSLRLEPDLETREAVERLADFFVSKGGVYAFVGRAAKIRLATLLIDEIAQEYR